MKRISELIDYGVALMIVLAGMAATLGVCCIRVEMRSGAEVTMHGLGCGH
jgi:hypothetical protein